MYPCLSLQLHKGSLTSSYSFLFRLSVRGNESFENCPSPSKRATALAWLVFTRDVSVALQPPTDRPSRCDRPRPSFENSMHSLASRSLLSPPSSSELLRVLSKIPLKFPALISLLSPTSRRVAPPPMDVRRLHAATLPKPERPPPGPTPARSPGRADGRDQPPLAAPRIAARTAFLCASSRDPFLGRRALQKVSVLSEIRLDRPEERSLTIETTRCGVAVLRHHSMTSRRRHQISSLEKAAVKRMPEPPADGAGVEWKRRGVDSVH